jgi:hypothetical protein
LTREQINKDLMLEIKAGSSGRPNAAAEAAKLERVTPMLVQLPGINPEPLARKYGAIVDIPIDELYIEGIPSITAMNAAMSKTAGGPSGTQPGTGDPATDPGAQGGEGGDNAPAPAQGNEGAQPAYPAPVAAPGGPPQVA